MFSHNSANKKRLRIRIPEIDRAFQMSCHQQLILLKIFKRIAPVERDRSNSFLDNVRWQVTVVEYNFFFSIFPKTNQPIFKTVMTRHENDLSNVISFDTYLLVYYYGAETFLLKDFLQRYFSRFQETRGGKFWNEQSLCNNNTLCDLGFERLLTKILGDYSPSHSFLEILLPCYSRYSPRVHYY